ncbi:hypothetical protein Lalb_Chr12g0206851 [Lupinus albus]|uniref:Uncharacterized protein n=1 Tax=Lupinus albus TaxID=3870 RepID=A0A6A4PNP0_LUPAL|nr:hypothetical protein Lalb_Chr12g0206851 [Lupinus albus]
MKPLCLFSFYCCAEERCSPAFLRRNNFMKRKGKKDMTMTRFLIYFHLYLAFSNSLFP